jgi:hypothetical protein
MRRTMPHRRLQADESVFVATHRVPERFADGDRTASAHGLRER